MGVLTLLEEARAAGLTLTVTAAGDRLRIKGPRRAIALAKALKAHKAEVLALLAIPKAEPNGVPHAQLTPREFAWETLAEERCGPTWDERALGIDSQGPAQTGPPPECALDPEAQAEWKAIQAEATPRPGPPLRTTQTTPAQVWRCRTPNCAAGWWQAPGGIIRCQRCERPPHVWWIVARGDLAGAPCVAPFRLRTTDPPRWRIEPWSEVPIRFGPAGAAVEPPGWIQDPEEETFEG